MADVQVPHRHCWKISVGRVRKRRSSSATVGFGSRSPLRGLAGGEEGFNPREASGIVKDHEGIRLTLGVSPAGMLVVIVLLLIAIAVVALWPTG